MRAVGFFKVEKERMAETGRTYDEEMCRTAQLDIILIQSALIQEDTEYAAFVWNTRKESYEQIGRPTETELLCRNRLQEYISNGRLHKDYDTSKVEIKRRTITMFASEWETLR